MTRRIDSNQFCIHFALSRNSNYVKKFLYNSIFDHAQFGKSNALVFAI